jgi:hypothetical protein
MATAESAAAAASALAVGYQPIEGEITGCDQGARESLGLDPDLSYFGVFLYFNSQIDAQTFVDLFEPGVVGIAQVTIFCAD